MKKRIIYSNNGTLEDITSELNNFHSGNFTSSIVASEDKIYLGSTLPFNHFKVRMGATVNTALSDINIRVWGGNEWEDIAEITDLTEVGGATLAQDGFIEFVPDKNNGWQVADTVKNNGDEDIEELGGVKIYDKYWLELTFSNDLDAGVVIEWLGQIFSNDDDLKEEFPDLLRSDMLASFEDGKTDWEGQHYAAAKVIIKDLIAMNVIRDKNQVLVREDLQLPSVQKVAQLVYNALGDDYTDQYSSAAKEYRERLKNAYVIVDLNADGRVDRKEQRPFVGSLQR